MKIEVNVKLHKHKDGVFEIQKGIYEIHTNQPAVDNRANDDVIIQLAEYFDVSKSAINIISGYKSKKKVFEITI